MTTFETLLLTEKDGVATLKINRPKMLNALSSQVLEELDLAIDEIAKSQTIRVLVLTGEGEKSFVAGADIKEMKDKTPLEGQAFSRLGNRVFAKLENLRQPVLAAINGFALGGGCELALACDMRFGTPKSKLGQPEVGLGIIPGFGGSQRLPRLIGTGRAKDLIYSGRIVGGEEAFQMGLLNKLFEPENLLEEVEKFAQLIAKQGPLAVEKAKDVINVGMELPLQQALLYEAEVFGNLFASEDQKEGMWAFVEKRPAQFKNK